MSMTKRQIEEEGRAKEMMRAINDNNVQKIEEVLENTKRQGKGFVLTSKFSQRRGSPRGHARSPAQQPHMPMVVGSPIGSPPPSRKSTPSPSRGPTRRKKSGKKKIYLTEIKQSARPSKVDMAIQSDDLDPDRMFPSPPPVTPERSEHGDDDVTIGRSTEEGVKENKEEMTSSGRKEPPAPVEDSPSAVVDEEVVELSKRWKKERRISSAKFARLGIGKRPPQFRVIPRPQPKAVKAPGENPEPLASNIYVTRVPKEGGKIKSPFYTQVDIPEGALPGDVIMKFETQGYETTKLDLGPDEKLCSCIVDIDLNPLTYCLQREATVRMRILKECVNRYDDVIVITSRHFSWQRVAARIESREVNGDHHYYAVADTQYLGKFAVITSGRADRFVMTSAGGLFASTIDPDVTMSVGEGSVRGVDHLVEMRVVGVRDEAVDWTSKQITSVQETPGTLVATSAYIDITKDIMGRSGLLQDGTQLPKRVTLAVPMTAVARRPASDDVITKWAAAPTLKVMRRGKAEPGAGILRGSWEDITAEQKQLLDPLAIQDGDAALLDARVPGEFLILLFDADVTSGAGGPQRDLGDVCDALLGNNRRHRAVVMTHQKVERPEIVSVHVVPEHAADKIHAQMAKTEEWRTTDVTTYRSDVMLLGEREVVDMRFREGFRTTVNQIPPELQFNSRRWQGYQFQLEASDDAFATGDAAIRGAIEFVVRRGDDVPPTSHTCYVTIARDNVRPYRPTVIVRPMPKVSVVREYKLKWLKNLSAAEKEKYKGINQP